MMNPIRQTIEHDNKLSPRRLQSQDAFLDALIAWIWSCAIVFAKLIVEERVARLIMVCVVAIVCLLTPFVLALASPLLGTSDLDIFNEVVPNLRQVRISFWRRRRSKNN